MVWVTPKESIDTIAAPTKSRRRFAPTRTLAGHSGWRSESGARGQGLVTSALGRLRENARPALRPACDWIAGLGQAGALNRRFLGQVPRKRVWSRAAALVRCRK